MKIYARTVLGYEINYNPQEEFPFFDFKDKMLDSVDFLHSINHEPLDFIKENIEESFKKQGINAQSSRRCVSGPQPKRGNGTKCATFLMQKRSGVYAFRPLAERAPHRTHRADFRQ